MVSLRYEWIPGSNIKISKPFKVGYKQYLVMLYLDEKRYEIIERTSGLVVASGGDVTNLRVLANKAKAAVASMGVTFIKKERKNES